MDAGRFCNAIRILRGLGERELKIAGIVDGNWGTPEASDRDQLGAFINDPFREMLRMPDANFDRLFALIESRQPKPKHIFDGTGDRENCAKCGANWRDTSVHLTATEVSHADRGAAERFAHEMEDQ